MQGTQRHHVRASASSSRDSAHVALASRAFCSSLLVAAEKTPVFVISKPSKRNSVLLTTHVDHALTPDKLATLGDALAKALVPLHSHHAVPGIEARAVHVFLYPSLCSFQQASLPQPEFSLILGAVVHLTSMASPGFAESRSERRRRLGFFFPWRIYEHIIPLKRGQAPLRAHALLQFIVRS